MSKRSLIVGTATVALGAIAWAVSRNIGVTLAAPALLYAGIQFSDARRTIVELEDLRGSFSESAARLDGIRGDLAESTHRLEVQLSTHRVGTFPAFLPEITELINGATREVLVFCPFPAYAEMSNPGGYADYANVMRRKGELVSLLCLDSEMRRELSRGQVRTGGWETWRADHLDRVATYLRTRKSTLLPESVLEHEFVQLLWDGDRDAIDEVFGSATKWSTKLVMPIYFWVVDGKRAIFALVPFTKETEWEVAFQTDDEALVGALTGIFQRYRVADETERL